MIQWKTKCHPKNQQRNKMQRRQYVDYINMCSVEKKIKKSAPQGANILKLLIGGNSLLMMMSSQILQKYPKEDVYQASGHNSITRAGAL